MQAIDPPVPDSTTYPKPWKFDRDRIGTHYACCYTSHPECAYLYGEEVERARIKAIIESHSLMIGTHPPQRVFDLLVSAIDGGDHA